MKRQISLLVALMIASAPAFAGVSKPSNVDPKSVFKSYSLKSPRTAGSARAGFKAAQVKSRGEGDLWTSAWQKMDNGEFSEAIEVLSQLISNDNNKANAFGLRAQCWFQLEKFDKAISDADQAVALDGKQLNPWLIKGLSHMAMGDGTSAISSFSEAIKIDPENSTARYNRGVCYLSAGKPEQAVEDETVVINQNPEDMDAYWSRLQGNAYLEKWPAVKADGKKMIELNRSVPEGHLGFAVGLQGSGDGYDAVAEYQKASVCFKDFGMPNEAVNVMYTLAELIPMYDSGKSRTPVSR